VSKFDHNSLFVGIALLSFNVPTTASIWNCLGFRKPGGTEALQRISRTLTARPPVEPFYFFTAATNYVSTKQDSLYHTRPADMYIDVLQVSTEL
jgi:hypothetical protein